MITVYVSLFLGGGVLKKCHKSHHNITEKLHILDVQ